MHGDRRWPCIATHKEQTEETAERLCILHKCIAQACHGEGDKDRFQTTASRASTSVTWIRRDQHHRPPGSISIISLWRPQTTDRTRIAWPWRDHALISATDSRIARDQHRKTGDCRDAGTATLHRWTRQEPEFIVYQQTVGDLAHTRPTAVP
jgi:hypothetical protein